MVFNGQELNKIIQAPISVEMKIDLLRQLHYQDVQEAVSEKQQLIIKGVENVLSNERAESNAMPDSIKHVDQFLPDALMLAKKINYSISSTYF